MGRPPRALFRLPLLALPLFAACGSKAEPRDGVIHLELRRADGRSHAAAILAAAGSAAAAPERGFEPLAGERGDWGLVALGVDARRAWPASIGVPLHAKATPPAGAVLRTAIAARAPARELAFRIDARPAEGGDWSALAEASAAPDAGWVPLTADLSALAGREIELRFLAASAADREAPARATPGLDGFWASPSIAGERPAQRRPNVVLVTLDTTRADVLGSGWTPNLDRIAAKGTRFDAAYATTNSTIPSHASILTGLALEEHGAIGNRHAFAEENDTLAERLRRAGYETAAAVSVSLLRPGFGFGQGFERYELPHENAFRDGAPATEAACAWVREWGSRGGGPFFLWLHLFDPHTPYNSPDEFARALLEERGLKVPPRRATPASSPAWDEPPAQLDFLRGTTNRERVVFEYQVGVAYADHLVGRLEQALDAAGLLGETLLIVTADHGESLGERDYWYEHANLYPEVVRVPLILAGHRVPEGKVLAEPVSLIDLVPTVLGYLALAGDETKGLEGADLLALARGAPPPERRIWFQLAGGKQAGFCNGDEHFIATLEDGLEWIAGAEPNEEGRLVPSYTTEPGGTYHLFDVRRDPALANDLGSAQHERAGALADEVRAWLATRKSAFRERRELSAEEESELINLGYAGRD